MAFLIIAAGCGSSSSESAGTETVQFEGETVALDLPAAEGRTAFAISDEEVIIGGGATRTPIENHEGFYNTYNAIHEVWLLDESGEAATLPPLDSDGIVQGLSGVQIDELTIVGGMDCLDRIQAESLSCQGRHLPVVWTLTEGDEQWQRHELPGKITEGALYTGTPTGGIDMWIFGRFDGEAYLSLTSDDVTRFIRFSSQDNTFEMMGDGEPNPPGWSSAPYCVTEGGEVIQLRARPQQGEGLASLGSWNYEAEAILVARLDLSGTWHEGAMLNLRDFFERDYTIVNPPSIRCVSDDAALASLSPVVREPDSDSTLGRFESRTLSVPVGVDVQNLAIGGPVDLDDLTSTPEGDIAPGVATRTSDGDIVLQIDGSNLYTIDESGELSLTQEPDQSTGLDGTSIFLYAGRIGTVNHRTGEVHVQ